MSHLVFYCINKQYCKFYVYNINYASIILIIIFKKKKILLYSIFSYTKYVILRFNINLKILKAHSKT